MFRPIAAIAIIIKNFERTLNGSKKVLSTPKCEHAVVMILASIKYRIKNGKIDFILTLSSDDLFSFFAL